MSSNTANADRGRPNYKEHSEKDMDLKQDEEQNIMVSNNPGDTTRARSNEDYPAGYDEGKGTVGGSSCKGGGEVDLQDSDSESSDDDMSGAPSSEDDSEDNGSVFSGVSTTPCKQQIGSLRSTRGRSNTGGASNKKNVMVVGAGFSDDEVDDLSDIALGMFGVRGQCRNISEADVLICHPDNMEHVRNIVDAKGKEGAIVVGKEWLDRNPLAEARSEKSNVEAKSDDESTVGTRDESDDEDKKPPAAARPSAAALVLPSTKKKKKHENEELLPVKDQVSIMKGYTEDDDEDEFEEGALSSSFEQRKMKPEDIIQDLCADEDRWNSLSQASLKQRPRKSKAKAAHPPTGASAMKADVGGGLETPTKLFHELSRLSHNESGVSFKANEFSTPNGTGGDEYLKKLLLEAAAAARMSDDESKTAGGIDKKELSILENVVLLTKERQQTYPTDGFHATYTVNESKLANSTTAQTILQDARVQQVLTGIRENSNVLHSHPEMQNPDMQNIDFTDVQAKVERLIKLGVVVNVFTIGRPQSAYPPGIDERQEEITSINVLLAYLASNDEQKNTLKERRDVLCDELSELDGGRGNRDRNASGGPGTAYVTSCNKMHLVEAEGQVPNDDRSWDDGKRYWASLDGGILMIEMGETYTTVQCKHPTTSKSRPGSAPTDKETFKAMIEVGLKLDNVHIKRAPQTFIDLYGFGRLMKDSSSLYYLSNGFYALTRNCPPARSQGPGRPARPAGMVSIKTWVARGSFANWQNRDPTVNFCRKLPEFSRDKTMEVGIHTGISHTFLLGGIDNFVKNTDVSLTIGRTVTTDHTIGNKQDNREISVRPATGDVQGGNRQHNSTYGRKRKDSDDGSDDESGDDDDSTSKPAPKKRKTADGKPAPKKIKAASSSNSKASSKKKEASGKKKVSTKKAPAKSGNEMGIESDSKERASKKKKASTKSTDGKKKKASTKSGNKKKESSIDASSIKYFFGKSAKPASED